MDQNEMRMMEMEAEMSRFEQEILNAEQEDDPNIARNSSRFVLGSNTFQRVQAQISGFPPGPHEMPPPGYDLPPPPPPPDLGHHRHGPDVQQQQLPPPPPSFMPPQLRHRTPRHMHPAAMGPGPPRMRMPGPPVGMEPQWNPPSYNQATSSSFMPEPQMEPAASINAVIEKPKIVYSAAPVRNVINKPPQPTVTEPVKEVKVEEPAPPPKVQHPKLVEEDTSTQATGMDLDDLGADGDGEDEEGGYRGKKKKKKFIRTAAGASWEDDTLTEWDPDDFRIFCGDLGNEVTDESLARAFSKYPSFRKAKVIRDKRTNKTRGYGFVSFKDPTDFVRAMREMNGKYVGNRPIKLRKSAWKDRNIEIVRKKEKEKKRLGLR